jgi:SnoaL-like domain
MVSAVQDAGLVHLTLNQYITVEGDNAHQDCYVILATRSPSRRPGTSQWVTSGRYRDELVREDGGWKFARREFAPDASIRSLPKWW